MKTTKRIIASTVLSGEPLDGSGRCCIHLFVPDQNGPFEEPSVLCKKLNENGEPIKGKRESRRIRGRLACDPKRTVAPVTRNGVIHITYRTSDIRAVTCPRCIASAVSTN